MTGYDVPELFGLALGTLRGQSFGFLSTLDRDQPHTRLVQNLATDDDGTTWIGTSPRSRKVAEVRDRPEVTYAAADHEAVACVTLQARARVIDDVRRRVALWRDELGAFFPDGPEGDDFVLLAMRPHRIEQMNFARQVHPTPFGLVPAVIVRDGDGWRPVPAHRS